MASESHRIRRAFVWAAGLALLAFIIVQALQAIHDSGPASRIKELMPTIGAQLVDAPVTDDQNAYTLEAPPAADGKIAGLTLASYRPEGFPSDGIIFLNFWATWCEPCVRELPSMISLKRRMRDKPFAMLAVSYDSDWPTISKFFDRVFGGTPQEFDIVRDPATQDQATLRWSFGTDKIPETYVIQNGRVLARFVNARDWASPEIIEYFERLTDPM